MTLFVAFARRVAFASGAPGPPHDAAPVHATITSSAGSSCVYANPALPPAAGHDSSSTFS